MVIFICPNSEVLTTLTTICSADRRSNIDQVNCCLSQKICEQEVIFICLREEPVVFFRSDGDFIPYTPRGRENLHENLHDLDRELSAEQIELSIRKELCDFAKLSENMFYVYNDIEHFKDEPQQETPNLSLMRDSSRPLPALLFSCQVGVGRTNLGLILGALVFHRLQGASKNPRHEIQKSEHKLDFQVIQLLISRLPKGQQVLDEVDDAVAMCSEMHNIKNAVYENKLKLEGIGEDYQIQGSSTKGYFLQRTLQSLERYVYLLIFNAYLHDQYPQAFPQNFSQWLCMNAWIYRLLASMDSSELSAPASLITDGIRVLVSSEFLATDLLSTAKEMKVANFRRVSKMALYGMAQPNSEALAVVMSYLTDQRRGHSTILWLNLQEELVLEANGQMFTPREPGCLEQPIPVCVQHPQQLQVFDHLLEAMKSSLAENPKCAFIFNCHNGKDRTTAAMVIATLTLWHINGFPECEEDEIVSVPDAKYTKGEFEVVMQVVRVLPDGHRVKREVDVALDVVSETMTPMHYHLREIIISTYRQIKMAKSEADAQWLRLRSLQYLERYIYLILFNCYLHLEKKDSWRRSFSQWMYQVKSDSLAYFRGKKKHL
ncbi:hypothetical protein cypCar_00010513 [Cyprinus carpio]|nr:hypothetical protein cypCar_00010513 [Cyprinus carpio]